ncbi:hypothetical protein BCR33DRAFT_711757 [Rhizoclosmatium globosum]|uniref:Uncharacterized protein n=1 Tax=Rhizoclosmatium globosum TaxID=329046 RepID=A0A1Y2CZL4_9FUNG|nr:hypothetical protein BCR33DRAFT_711757 [Rhizoclosmatium globosum]|eukprot:ORY52440.1 hypothetical protein BCR33DRAFT_711757 [Rhizoclosmatium globosum]
MGDFVGLRVEVELVNGYVMRGIVTAAAATGLVVDGQHVPTAAIRDLRVVAAPPPPPFSDPAIVSVRVEFEFELELELSLEWF